MGITQSSVVASPIDEVFAWHARPGAFARLAPPWQPLSLRSEADSLEDGIAVLGLPGGLTWVSRHDPTGYEPPHRFVDVISSDGPSSVPVSTLLRWRHSHEFAEIDPSHTRVTDRVETPIGSKMLRPMFRYRHRQLAEDLASHRVATAHGAAQMTIAMTGSSGLIGSALSAFLTTGGHTVIRLVRRPARDPLEREWDPQSPASSLLDGVDAVVHLAGASIAGRFTKNHKYAIRDSRIEPTRLLAELAASTRGGPKVFVVASAIGIYGADRGNERLDEGSSQGGDFLAQVVKDWEEASSPARSADLRVATIRTGIVQSAAGGSLKIYRPLFSLGVGGRIAGGKQWVSWIDIDDLIDIYHRALFDERMTGPVNAVAPNPVRNAEYARTLGRVLSRPAILPVPAIGPRFILGAEGSRNLVEGGQFVMPAVLRGIDHSFRRPDLESSLRHQLGRLLPPTAEEVRQNTAGQLDPVPALKAERA